jgi:P27 family predicted phage terminase small subunit
LFTEEGRQGDVVRLRFRPNPQYRPTTRQANVFHHMAGNVSVNAKQLRLVQIEGKLMDAVKFGGGLLGHLDKGGWFSVRDTEIGPGIWDTTYLDVNMHGKALFFHTIAVTEKEIHSLYRRVPDNLTLEQAAALLEQNQGMPRGMKVKTHPAEAIAQRRWIITRSFCSEFGLSPVSRTRLPANNATKDGEDDLMELLNKPWTPLQAGALEARRVRCQPSYRRYSLSLKSQTEPTALLAQLSPKSQNTETTLIPLTCSNELCSGLYASACSA